MLVVSAAEAARLVLASCPVQPTLRMPLADAANHILAEDAVAAIPLPPWTNASMDGYAVRGSDIAPASRTEPVRLRVVGVIAAGRRPIMPLAAGEAIRIFTGAPVPPGADSVVRQEDTDRGEEIVRVFAGRDAGANVRQAGGDLTRGAIAVRAGDELRPAQLAILAALGQGQPMVYRRPRVGILCTGDEVVPLDQVDAILAGERLADVNGIALAALVAAAGGIPVPLGIAPDDEAATTTLAAAAVDVDLLITAGGVSVGDHDHVRHAMQRLGAEPLFDRVRMRPGGPTTFGVLRDGRRWLGLPGNPVSAMVTFDLFGRTAIRAMTGHRQPQRVAFRALLAEAVRPDRLLDLYLRCRFTDSGDRSLPLATLTGPQGSGMLMSMVGAEGLVLVPAGTAIVAKQAEVSATLLD